MRGLRSCLTAHPTRLESILLAFAVLTWLARVLVMDSTLYWFMGWNLFLAWVPLLLLTRLRQTSPRGWRQLVLAAAFLLFLPNAPYLVTDLIHPWHAYAAGATTGVALTAALTLLCAAVGMLWWIRAVDSAVRLAAKRHFLFSLPGARTTLTLVIALASACGVWMGRTLRLNTWDVLTNPVAVLEAALWLISSPGVLERVLFTWILLAFTTFFPWQNTSLQSSARRA